MRLKVSISMQRSELALMDELAALKNLTRSAYILELMEHDAELARHTITIERNRRAEPIIKGNHL